MASNSVISAGTNQITLSFKNPSSDLLRSPIARGTIGSTTVYKYDYSFPNEIATSGVSVCANVDLSGQAFFDASGELIPYNLTCLISASAGALHAVIWLHIYGKPESIMVANADGSRTTDLDNLQISLNYVNIGTKIF